MHAIDDAGDGAGIPPAIFSSRLRTLLIKAIAVAPLAQRDSDSTRKSIGCVVTSVPAGK
jgi:hypothetical protein